MKPIEQNITGLTIEHNDLYRALALSVQYNEDERPHIGEYLRGQFNDFEDAVADIPGYQGVFGTGHPFYAWKPDGGVYAIQEITDYTNSFLPRLSADKARQIGGWPCATCQRENDLPDLKQECKPCERVVYKPRDLFKVTPDVDFWIVVDNDNAEIEQEIESNVRERGFYTSDEAIKPALDTTINVLADLASGNIPDARLPIDLHVVGKSMIVDALKQVIPQLSRTDHPGFIPISPRSLHVSWEKTDEPYDFLKDFLFSLTPYGWTDATLTRLLTETQRAARLLVGDSVVDRVEALAPKEGRQLSTPGIRQNLKDRINSW